MNRQSFFRRVQATENELAVARLAVAHLQLTASADPSRLRSEGVSIADLRACRDHLEATYVIRLFAEFEAPLCLYWRDVRRRRKTWNTIRARILMERVATYQHVPVDVLWSAQSVREFRNALVHGPGTAASGALTFGQCRSALCHFLSFLPVGW